MSERRCRQVMNRFGYPLAGSFDCGDTGAMWHDEADITSGCAQRQKDCLHHEPLYAEPVATTAEVCSVDGYRKDHVLHRKGACAFVPPQPAADAHRHDWAWRHYDTKAVYCHECGDVMSAREVLALLNERAGGK